MEFLEKIDIRSWRNEVQRHLTKWSFFALGYALRSLRVQVSLPSFSQTLVNRSRDWSKRPFSTNEPWELDSFPASTRGKEKREMDPLGGAQNRFVCALNESRLRIDHESFARESEFFPGTKEICFEGWRRPILPSPIFHFNRKFGLREPLPRAKIRACLFPNCHRGRVERKGMEEGIDTGEFKSLRREKGIWFGDLNRVEFLAVGQVFFYFFNFLEFINTSKIHFFSLLSLKRNFVYSSKSVQETRLIEEATFRCVTRLRPFFYPCHIRVRVYLAPICLFQAKLRVKECRAGKYLHWRAMMRMQWTGNVILSCRSWLRSECD